MIRTVTACLVLFLSLSFVATHATAHPPDTEGHHDGHAQERANVPTGLILPDLPGPAPWSDKPALTDPNRFQIAIMTDRTGGHRPGVWMKAVRSVNLLRPDFVVSVGDLIEGYTEDEEQVQAEWNEFLGFIDQMDMKFFFVAGNHDVTNPLMHRIWRERFGPEWYSFNYKDVHFVCLCSEDPNFRISDKQLAWLEKDLEQSRDARWTLVFLHKPLWFISERYLSFGIKDTTNWKPVERRLHGRRHTVFAGHQHHYAQFDRNGTKFYQLATTGGASQLRGVQYGEFDHVMWLTMEDDGPRVANLLLDGIVAPDEVTEESLKQLRKFLAQAKIEVLPILLDDIEGFSEGQIDIRLVNEFDSPVSVSGRIEGLPLRGLTVKPVSLNLTAEPGATQQLSVSVRFTETVPFVDLASTVFRVRIESSGVKPFAADQAIPVIIDRRYRCPARTAVVQLDGRLDDWAAFQHRTPSPPLLIGPAQQWQGNNDASIAFSLTRDQDNIYLAAKVTDDHVLADRDELVFLLDARPIGTRSRNSEFGPGCHSVTFRGADANDEIKMLSVGDKKYACKSAVRVVDDGYVVEAELPAALISDQQGEDWHSFQATLLAQDVDDPTESPCGVAWRGTQAIRQANDNYGNFVRDR